ncbi:hypothetical protein [Flavobacterium sp. F52]|uniref:hypothetical protein n=1 Tax=Flavobacterium sp. F52 TaxID=1202532 RepID=UPI0003154D71|nr:hypothetical protein [Flavobacterium sp. F52]
MEILIGGQAIEADQNAETFDDGRRINLDCGIGLAGLALTVVGAAAVVTTGGAALFAASFILGSIGTARSC